MTDSNKNDLEIYEKGTEQRISEKVGDIPYHVVPKGMQILDLSDLAEQFRDRPHRLQQTMLVHSAESFVEYFNRFANENSSIAIDHENGKIVGVLDYHESESEPRYGSHKVVYKFPHTPEYTKWMALDNERLDQETFALFIEERYCDIIEPSAADMLQVALTLKAKQSVTFKQSTRLENGQIQFVYDEKIDGTAGLEAGTMKIPEVFKIQIQIFRFGDSYKIAARLRYRISSGGLKMWFTLINPERSFDDAVAGIETVLKDKCNTDHIYMATL